MDSPSIDSPVTQLGADLLTVSGISKSFGGVAAVQNCTLSISPNTVTAIIGPNGAGKSTLMNLIGGLYHPDSGKIIFNNQDITILPHFKHASAGLIRTFQIARELTNLTVFENVVLAGQSDALENPFAAFLKPGFIRREEQRIAKRAQDILKKLGLFRLADDLAGSLSGGQKKLLELARALMLDPKLILLDEPATGVSPPMVRELARTILSLRDEGLTIGLIEHDMELVEELSDQVHVMAEGRVLISGTFNEVVSDKRVVDAYLGNGATHE